MVVGPHPTSPQEEGATVGKVEPTDLLLKGPKEYGPCVLSFVIACLLAAHQVD